MAMPPLSAMPAEKFWSGLLTLALVGAARKCWPGKSCVPADIVSNVVGVIPQPLDFFISHPPMSTVAPVGLKISMNSSLAPFCPRVRNSLMTT